MLFTWILFNLFNQHHGFLVVGDPFPSVSGCFDFRFAFYCSEELRVFPIEIRLFTVVVSHKLRIFLAFFCRFLQSFLVPAVSRHCNICTRSHVFCLHLHTALLAASAFPQFWLTHPGFCGELFSPPPFVRMSLLFRLHGLWRPTTFLFFTFLFVAPSAAAISLLPLSCLGLLQP